MAISDINDELNKLGDKAYRFLNPRKCPFCEGRIGKELICPDCKNTLPYCEEIQEDPEYRRCASCVYYEGKARKALDDFVHGGKAENLSCLGYMMAETAEKYYNDQFDIISFVPYNKKEARVKHDAPRFLCASVCVDWHTTPVETLKKKNDEISVANVDAFKGQRILLVDDVIESGGTLRKCVQLLTDAGAKDVMCLTFARNR